MLVSACSLAVLMVPGDANAQGKGGGTLLTVPERTKYEQTSRYEDVMAFVQRVVASAPAIMHLDTMGYTFEGRVMPLVVVGRNVTADPASVKRAGKTVIYIQANIHAGEVEGKEAAQQLLRELAAGEHRNWLDSLVLLVNPIYNADGNERVSLTNRPLQYGPVAGMGQRANAQGFDLNRDEMKLDAPEAISVARLFVEYDPHVSMDLHTTNGTRHGYMLTYSPPLHPNTDSAIIKLLRGSWLPQVTQEIDKATGWDMYYYGDVGGQGDKRGWYTFEHKPRYVTNYIGLRNRFSILSEAFSYATFEDRIRATRLFVTHVLDYAAAHAGEIRRVTAAADAAAQQLTGKPLALAAEFERSPQQVQILLGETQDVRNPYSGAVMLLRKDVQKPEMMYEYGTFSPTLFERVPSMYYVPVSARNVLAKLAQHGIVTRPLAKDTTIAGQRFAIDSTYVAEREYQTHKERTILGKWNDESVTLPAGQYLAVSLKQPLARLIFALLEPRSDDGLATWNALERELASGAKAYPILRSF